MNDGFAQSYLMFTGLMANALCLTLILIEAMKQVFKAYCRARLEIVETLSSLDEAEKARMYAKVKV